jgi:hypothetical protein
MPWRPSYKSDTIIDQIGYSEPIYPVCVIGHATVLTATKAAVQGWRWNVCPFFLLLNLNVFNELLYEIIDCCFRPPVVG